MLRLQQLTLCFALLATLLGMTSARTDLSGCTSSTTVNQYHEAILIWYVPSTGEICDIPDCGGGRAPPRYDDPACPGYTGTATYSPSYLPGYGGAAVAPSTVVVSAVGAAATGDADGTAGMDGEDGDGSDVLSFGATFMITAAVPSPTASSSAVKNEVSSGSGSGSGASSTGSATIMIAPAATSSPATATTLSSSASSKPATANTNTTATTTTTVNGSGVTVPGYDVASVMAVIAAMVGLVML
ncbi:hypothetical protein VTN77DRAFT_9225 [Rasamsonia byssochlamydoides]|uniref:uncharacterized protein n=1 Tax=Rasamsonia byssochlamydoides TaxID=89139 RepID=UPI003742E69D